MSLASGAYTVVSATASGVKTGASYAAAGASKAADKAWDGKEAISERMKGPTVYRPAPLRDTYESDMKNAR